MFDIKTATLDLLAATFTKPTGSASAELESLLAGRGIMDIEADEPSAAPTSNDRKAPQTAAEATGLDPRGLRTRRPTSRRIFRDAQQAEKNAVELLRPLPRSKETLHLVLPGSFVPLDLVAALLEITGQTATSLRLATLGFSDSNVETLCRMLDTGQVKSLSLVCSRYFAAASKPIYEHAAQELPRRGAQLLATRSHAKVMLIETGRDRWTFEGSGNLRSCVCLEQVALTSDRQLFRFHAGWFDRLFTNSPAGAIGSPAATTRPNRFDGDKNNA